ncbi:MAG: glucosaminidase domain-containing protein [Rhodospirillales bacterium]|nr:MAG: glucosaminidase domain-containing protein [Rhodospirillales bacterium]
MAAARDDRAANPQPAAQSLWPGLVSGLLGIFLLIAVETTFDHVGRAPAIQYAPAIQPERGAFAVDGAVTLVPHPTVAAWQTAFAEASYDLEAIRSRHVPVPRLRLAMLPRDLPLVTDVERRKTVFISLLLPLILEANARVAMERRRLRAAIGQKAAGRELPRDMIDWLDKLAKRYRSSAAELEDLWLRVDTVPPSLVLAQAAAESGWGTSRFAVEGNAIFGQWTTAGGKGLVPLARPEGQTYKVRSFDRLIDSVNAYLLNLNTHRSYRAFRGLRAELRDRSGPTTSLMLAGKLGRYSEKGEDYVELLREIIRRNRLQTLDRASLGDTLIAPALSVGGKLSADPPA